MSMCRWALKFKSLGTKGAQEQLTLLEEGSSTDSLRDISSDSSPVAAPSRGAPEVPVQTGLFDTMAHPVLDALSSLEPDELTPREALNRMYHLKQLLEKQ